MTFRSLCLCLVLTGATTAFGQQQQVSVQVEGGRVVGQYIPNGPPEPDGYVPIQQVQPPQGGVQPQQHSHQHGAGCTCGQCQRTVVGRTTQIFTKTHMTKVTTEHSVIDHGVQSFNESPPPACPPQQQPLCPTPCPTQQRRICSPQNFCGQQGMRGNTGGPISSWDTRFDGYDPRRYQQQQRGGLFGSLGNRPLVSANASVAVLGYGPRMNVSVGRNPPMQALPSWR